MKEALSKEIQWECISPKKKSKKKYVNSGIVYLSKLKVSTRGLVLGFTPASRAQFHMTQLALKCHELDTTSMSCLRLITCLTRTIAPGLSSFFHMLVFMLCSCCKYHATNSVVK